MPCFEDCRFAAGVFGVGAKGNGYTITRVGRGRVDGPGEGVNLTPDGVVPVIRR